MPRGPIKRKAKPMSAIFKRKPKRSKLPRKTIQKNPLTAPNKYNFMRSFASSISIGLADTINNIYINTDNKCQIIKLRVKASQLPDFSDFKALFNQYKITSVHSNLIPYYKDNQPLSMGDPNVSGYYGPAIPNYQIYYLPENFSTDYPDFQNKTIVQIDDYINQSQKKAYKLMPGKQKQFWNTRPSVPDSNYDAKGGILQPSKMIKFPFTDCDQDNIECYGLQLLIMRVDRKAFNTSQSSATSFQNMGWRVINNVYLTTRKVQ